MINVLTNWATEKHTECIKNKVSPLTITNFPSVVVNRHVLCNSEIESETHFLLEALTAFAGYPSKLTIKFTMNKASVNNFDN